MKTQAVGDQQGAELAIEIEWKTAPVAEARKVIGMLRGRDNSLRISIVNI